MKPRLLALAVAAAMAIGPNVFSQGGTRPQGPDDAYLTWTAARAEAVGKAAYQRGRVGGIFWVTFPLRREDGTPLFSEADRTAQLIVRIVSKEGRVEWPVPASMRAPVN